MGNRLPAEDGDKFRFKRRHGTDKGLIGFRIKDPHKYAVKKVEQFRFSAVICLQVNRTGTASLP